MGPESYPSVGDMLECDPVLLGRLAVAASSTLERDELLQLLFVELNRVIPCQSVGYSWRDPGGDLLLTAVISTGVDLRVEHGRVPVAPGDPEDLPHAYSSPDNPRSVQPLLKWLAGRGFASTLSVPVVLAQQTLGRLVVSRTRPHAFLPQELRPLVQTAHLIGPALNSFRLYERLEAAHKDLAMAKDELARSERLMVQGELASGVAHDLNNILCLIAARADLLKLQGLPPQATASVDAIRQAVDDGIAVVQRMTRFAGRQRRQELVVLELNGLIQDALEMTRPRWQLSARAKEAPIQVRFKAGEPSAIMGVPSELREVMVNLVMNAVDAMPSGGEINVETSQDGHWAVLAVSDTGCGMSEEVKQHIFEPFFTTKGEGGSGLGLWVCHGIIARHGGDIQVESQLGRGSCFRVRLPLARSSTLGRVTRSPDRKQSILVVDDEVGLGETVRLSLEMVGYDVVFSADPRRALEIFRGDPADLVITDLRMPGMSGWELAAEIKRFSPATPIIAMTGWPVDLIRDGQRCSDMEAIIQKPYRVNDLRTKVAKILSEKAKKS